MFCLITKTSSSFSKYMIRYVFNGWELSITDVKDMLMEWTCTKIPVKLCEVHSYCSRDLRDFNDDNDSNTF